MSGSPHTGPAQLSVHLMKPGSRTATSDLIRFFVVCVCGNKWKWKWGVLSHHVRWGAARHPGAVSRSSHSHTHTRHRRKYSLFRFPPVETLTGCEKHVVVGGLEQEMKTQVTPGAAEVVGTRLPLYCTSISVPLLIGRFRYS